MTPTIAPAERRLVRATHDPRFEVIDRRSEGGGLRVRGRAIAYGQWSDIGPFREAVAPGALRRALARPERIRLLWSHDEGEPLAATGGAGLELEDRADGLWFSATMANSSRARDVVEYLRTGLLDSCSYGFTIGPKGDSWETRDGTRWRTIRSFERLHEVTLTTIPATQGTSAEEARARLQGGAPARRRRLMPAPAQGPYSPAGEHSFFEDLATRAAADRRLQAAQMSGLARVASREGIESSPEIPRPGAPTVREARRRLEALRERRDLTAAGATSGLPFVPLGWPSYLADEFVTKVRQRGMATQAVRVEQIPPTGQTLTVPKFTTGSSTAIQTSELDAPSETDPVSTSVTAAVVTIAGQTDMSMQLADRSQPGMADVVIARDLAEDYAAKLDAYAWPILVAAAGTSTVWTDASPTSAEFWDRLMFCRGATATALGHPPDVLVLHPRRYSWLVGQGTSLQFPQGFRWPGTLLEAGTLPITLGAGTEDEVLLVGHDENPLYLGGPTTRVMAEPLSANLAVRVQVYGYAALIVRRAEAIGKLTGSGLAAPT